MTRGSARSSLRFAGLAAIGLLAGCATPPPDWQLNAKSALDRSVAAYLAGDTRTAAAEMERARGAIASTGRIDLLARAELVSCAARVASLVFEPCARFETLRADAPPAERAYADYLGAQVRPDEVALLPPPQRAPAAATADATAASAVRAIEDPLSRLVAAAIVFRRERASPEVLAGAVETASAQGWRRPLLAWLNVQRLRAEKLGQDQEVERLRRRIAIVERGG